MAKSIEQAGQAVQAGYRHYPDLAPLAGDEGGHGMAQPAQSAQQRARRERRFGSALGWVSVGIGVASLLAPRAAARAAGLPDWPLVLRAIGVRELVSGVGLLTAPTSQRWRWSRVAGDAMDLALLGVAAAHPASNRVRLAATAALVGSLAGTDLRAGNPPRITPSRLALAGPHGGQRVQRAVAINRPPDECYRFWRDLERLPSFMQHVESVKVTGERMSHWRARAPAGRHVEWDAELTEDQPGQVLGWRSVKGSDIEHAGTVRFVPDAGGGTIVQVRMRYQPPAGRAGALVARLFGAEPSLQIKQDLRRFKQLIETGEIPTTKGQPSGVRALKSRLLRSSLEN